MNCPTISLPFGRDIDTMILCRDDDQRRNAIRALAIPARYELIGSALCGHRFSRIIVIAGEPKSATEAAMYERILKEDLPTKLAIGGDLIVL